MLSLFSMNYRQHEPILFFVPEEEFLLLNVLIDL